MQEGLDMELRVDPKMTDTVGGGVEFIQMNFIVRIRKICLEQN